jgi:hypothetical protein
MDGCSIESDLLRGPSRSGPTARGPGAWIPPRRPGGVGQGPEIVDHHGPTFAVQRHLQHLAWRGFHPALLGGHRLPATRGRVPGAQRTVAVLPGPRVGVVPAQPVMSRVGAIRRSRRCARWLRSARRAVVAGGHPAVALEPGDAALHGMPLPVGVGLDHADRGTQDASQVRPHSTAPGSANHALLVTPTGVGPPCLRDRRSPPGVMGVASRSVPVAAGAQRGGQGGQGGQAVEQAGQAGLHLRPPREQGRCTAWAARGRRAIDPS